jgi:hypothetical protein
VAAADRLDPILAAEAVAPAVVAAVDLGGRARFTPKRAG